jgi:CBS domain containing-hemolysin-like protein
MDYYSWLIIIITLTLSAFFSGIEIAFITANKLRIELKKTQGSFIARILGGYVKEPSRFISTTLVGNNVVIVIYGIYMGMVIENAMRGILPEPYGNEILILLVQTIISTIIVLIFAEFLPKVIFRANPDRMLFALVLPFRVFYFLFLPVTRFAEWVAMGMLKTFSKTPLPKKANHSFTKIDLDQYISESANMDLDEDTDVDAEMFKNALDFDKLKTRDCMLPRTDVVGIELNEDIEELYQLFISSGHSRILLYQETIDNIIGYAHQADMFKQPKQIKHILIPIIMVTESTPASDLLKRFTAERKSIALVLDEFGGTAGIVTLEDILEEIIGDIDDEHDVEELLEKKISDIEFEFSARLEVDYLNETYDLEIPEGDYETLGGFIIAQHEDIPEAGEKLALDGFKITVLKQESARIEEVRLKVLKQND